ncbi:alpha/beta hydrolase family protein [Scopulibacillus darangshiensis]|nr:hypothetical protein [Scopulibacillus darangshiensis]
MKPIEVPDSNSDTKNYQMMYWSQGIKVEAYVAAPSESGAYPLSVFCHGGYSTPDDQKAHVTTIGEGNDLFHYDKTLIENYPSGQITIVPMYRGYGHSGGTISGLAKNAADTQNAIKAVTTYFNTHKNFPGINKGHLYLSGVSLGSVKSSMKNLHGLQ